MAPYKVKMLSTANSFFNYQAPAYFTIYLYSRTWEFT